MSYKNKMFISLLAGTMLASGQAYSSDAGYEKEDPKENISFKHMCTQSSEPVKLEKEEIEKSTQAEKIKNITHKKGKEKKKEKEAEEYSAKEPHYNQICDIYRLLTQREVDQKETQDQVLTRIKFFLELNSSSASNLHLRGFQQGIDQSDLLLRIAEETIRTLVLNFSTGQAWELPENIIIQDDHRSRINAIIREGCVSLAETINARAQDLENILKEREAVFKECARREAELAQIYMEERDHLRRIVQIYQEHGREMEKLPLVLAGNVLSETGRGFGTGLGASFGNNAVERILQAITAITGRYPTTSAPATARSSRPTQITTALITSEESDDDKEDGEKEA